MIRMGEMRPVKRYLVGLVVLASLASPLAHADRVRYGPPSTDQYFVDFRVRSGGVFGHTYVVYGRIDGRGRIVSPRYAGLYPAGPFSRTALLAVLAVPGKVSADAADHRRRPRVIYRRRLSAAAFRRLQRTVQSERRTPQAWDLLLYNCNSFTAYVARAIGLQVPPTFEFPIDFVRDLYVMNRDPRLPAHVPSDRDTLYRFRAATGRVQVWR